MPIEEKVLEEYYLKLKEQEYPVRVSQLKFIAGELLKTKGDIILLEKNQPSLFLKYYSNLKSIFMTLQDQNRQLSKDQDIISYQFELYKETITKFRIKPKNMYNIDKKEISLSQGFKIYLIISKSNQRPKLSQDRSQEQATLIKAILLIDKVLSLQIIFKGIINKTSQTKKLKALYKT